MVSNYNETRHSSIKMTPAKASMRVNEKTVFMNLYGKKVLEPIVPRFSIGDKVRLTKKKNIFEKRYTPR